MIGMLDPHVTAIADGGGVVSAVLDPIEGAEHVALAGIDLLRRAPGLTLLERTVNGQPGLVVRQDGTTAAVLAFDITGSRIRRIWAISNPQKLRPWTTN